MGRLGDYMLRKKGEQLGISDEDFLRLSMNDYAELLVLMMRFVKDDKEAEWLSTPLPAIGGERPIDLIRSNRMRPLIDEFYRLRDGQPV